MNEVKKLREPTCYNCPHRVHYGGDVPMKKYGVMMRLGDVFCVFGKKARRFKKSDPTETVIHCDFEAPASAEMWERLKENFTAAYGRKTPVNEIPLKDVHIGTGCLEPIAAALPEPEGEICVLIAYSLLGGYIEPLAVSARKDYLLRKIDEHLASMAENMDAALQLKDVFCSSEQNTMEFHYGLADQPVDGSELLYTIVPVPFFACGEEVAA